MPVHVHASLFSRLLDSLHVVAAPPLELVEPSRFGSSGGLGELWLAQLFS